MTKKTSTAGKVPSSKEQGFTYILALAAIVIVGIIIGVAHSTSWYLLQSNREAELLFRGEAYRQALGSYYEASPGVKAFPRTLKELLVDKRFPDGRPHIRKLYDDPMARGEDKQWRLIRGTDGGIVGVASKSEDEPLKQSNFSKEQAHLASAKSYAAWEFTYKPKTKTTTTTIKTPVK